MIQSSNISNFNNLNSVIAGGFTSQRKVWIIGGNFLKSSIDYCHVLRSLYDKGREKMTFFDTFDVDHFTSDHTNPLLCMNQAFFKAINNRGFLPALIVLMIDEDIFMTPELYLPSEIETHLRWIFKNIDQTIKSRRRNMPLRLLTPGEPHVYVLRSLPHCDVGIDPNIMIFQDRHQKFNALLQAIGRCYAIGTINIQTIDPQDTRCYKQSDGTILDTKGHYRLWRELFATMSDILREMDKDKRKRILQEEVNRKPIPRHRAERY